MTFPATDLLNPESLKHYVFNRFFIKFDLLFRLGLTHFVDTGN